MNILFAFLISFLALNTVFAQEIKDSEVVITDVEGLRADFVQKTQNPENLQLEFEMILNSEIDSDRVKITWSLVGDAAFLYPEKKTTYIDIKKGERYVVPIVIIPVVRNKTYGYIELSGVAEAFKADKKFLATVRKNLVTNSMGEILPITEEYNYAKNLMNIKNLVIGFAIIAALAGGGYIFFKKFVFWLNKEEEEYFKNKAKL